MYCDEEAFGGGGGGGGGGLPAGGPTLESGEGAFGIPATSR